MNVSRHEQMLPLVAPHIRVCHAKWQFLTGTLVMSIIAKTIRKYFPYVSKYCIIAFEQYIFEIQTVYFQRRLF